MFEDASEEGVVFGSTYAPGPLAAEEALPHRFQQLHWVVAVESVAEDEAHCLLKAVHVGADFVSEGEAAVDDSKATFEALGLSADLLRGVYAMGFQRPSRIQAKALPLLMRTPYDKRSSIAIFDA